MTPWSLLETALFLLCALALAVSAVSRLLVCAFVRHRAVSHPTSVKVTILKPLCGADPSLAENLGAFSRQSHQNLDIVFGVAELEDAALPVALRFCREHVGVRARINVGDNRGVDNPKLALLQRMSRLSDSDWVVVSDSNVRVTERYVEDALAHAAPDVGLITHLVSGRGGRSLGAHLENLQLNCFVAPGVCGVRFIAGRTCVIGKSMFLRRDALDKIGSFEAAGSFLAEDYVIGRALERAGYRVVTASMPVPWSSPELRLIERIARLDPRGVFRQLHVQELALLDSAVRTRSEPSVAQARSGSTGPVCLMFAVGGAGAQAELVQEFLPSLRPLILEGRLRLELVAGTRPEVFRSFADAVERSGLGKALERDILIVQGRDFKAYYEAFNRALLRTDVLWTKPSELSFYPALGMACVLSRPVGAHERYNRRWLREQGVGLKQRRLAHTRGWFEEWLEDGTLAAAAWSGFVRIAKQGTESIAELVTASQTVETE